MALTRVYCGLARSGPDARSAGSDAWLTAAVVDDAGRLLDVCDIADDAAGYADLGALLAERSGGAGGVAVAADSDEHEITLLLAAAGRLLAVADDEMVIDYAERFADDESPEEVGAADNERHAVGLARALQAGALAATSQPAPREFMALGPVLAAHAALATSRHGSAIALREVLRELYPAALRAYPDPAEAIPLAILDALPEPSLLGVTNRGRDAAVAAELALAGVADAGTIADAITALRVAAAETPRRTGIGKGPTSAVAETIRQVVAAVRACDGAIAALVGLLAAKDGGTRASAPTRLRQIGPRAIEAASPASHAEPAPYATSAPSWSNTVRDEPKRPESARHDAARASRRSRGTSTTATGTGRSAPMSAPPASLPVTDAPTGRPSRTAPQRSARSGSRPASTRTPEYEPARGMSTVDANGPADGRRASWNDEMADDYPPVGYADADAAGERQGDHRQSRHGDDSDRRQTVAYPAAGRPAAQPYDYPVQPSYVGDAAVRPGSTPYGFAPNETYPSVSTGYSPYSPPTGHAPAEPGYPVESRYPSTSDYPAANGYSAANGHSAPTGYPPAGAFPPAGAIGPGPSSSDRVAGVAAAVDPGLPTAGVRAPGSRDSWPLNPHNPDDDLARPVRHDADQYGRLDAPQYADPGIPRQRDGRVAPPWQTDDLAPPPEPAVLRTGETPMLRLVGRDDHPESAMRSGNHTQERETLLPEAAYGDEPDEDLLIFAQARSAWFVGPEADDGAARSWSDAADHGWSAAQRAAHPSIDGETEVGLPRRVPKANLVPGSPLPPRPDEDKRAVRDPAAMAAHTTGYFRGSRRGEEVRGYAVGGRPGRESGDGWDFSRDGWDTDREPEYRSAAHW